MHAMLPSIIRVLIAVIGVLLSLGEIVVSTEEFDLSNVTVAGTSTDFISQLGGCEFPLLENAEVLEWRKNFTIGEKAQVVCHDGYRFQPNKLHSLVIACHPDGIWRDLFGTEQMLTCYKIGVICLAQPLGPFRYITLKTDGYMPGDLAPVQCSEGYCLHPLDAKPFLICSNDGTWKTLDQEKPLTCEAIKYCPLPVQIKNGIYMMLTPEHDHIRHSGLARLREGTKAFYYCNTGFVNLLSRNSSEFVTPLMTCKDGAWKGDLPVCMLKQDKDECPIPPKVDHARPFFSNGSLSIPLKEDLIFGHGVKVFYVCEYGYLQQGSSMVACEAGEWNGLVPKCIPDETSCASPPVLDHGNYSLHGKSKTASNDKIADGTRAYYYCNNGYKMKETKLSILTCSFGSWMGNLSTCVKRENCDAPMDIENGNWIIESIYADFRIGVSVTYECDDGFKAIGSTKLSCQMNGYWSDYGPRCLPIDLYCSEPESLSNGFFMCKPSSCDFFRVETEVHYVCNKNYEPRPNDSLIQMCLPGGQWSGSRPVCQPVMGTPGSYLTGINFLQGSSMAVVISTACGVLGLMVLIMTIVIVKRSRKSRRIRRRPPASRTPYHLDDFSSRQLTSSVEQDRQALIPDINFNVTTMPPVLPTYEEAIIDHRPLRSPITGSRVLSVRPSRREYRPLPGSRPTIMTTMAAVDFNQDQNRNSITTLSSNMTRADNMSIAFGSIDTVNVSDGMSSMSATVDTLDSISSNPSIALSHLAVAGSIDSNSAYEHEQVLSNEA